MFISILPVIGNIQGGKLNALAVASPNRVALIPDVPTISESGLPGFSAVITYGLAAPAGTPRPIVERLNKELQTALQDATLQKRLASEGGQVLAGHARGLRRRDRPRREEVGPAGAGASISKVD